MDQLKEPCILPEQNLERDIQYLSCRHHILEIILSNAFKIKMYIASAPDVLIFKRFKNLWPNINVENLHISWKIPLLFSQYMI